MFLDSSIEDWGQTYGGVGSKEECYGLPQEAQAGCIWRFEDFKGADNPGVRYRRVKCGDYPELYERSGCLLKEDVVA